MIEARCGIRGIERVPAVRVRNVLFGACQAVRVARGAVVDDVDIGVGEALRELRDGREPDVPPLTWSARQEPELARGRALGTTARDEELNGFAAWGAVVERYVDARAL